jgi:acyl-CoA ligase (AMP-forming) (exosortase A-associated)
MYWCKILLGTLFLHPSLDLEGSLLAQSIRLFHEILLRSAEAAPQQPALTHGTRTETYSVLAKETLGAASGLREIGVRPNDRVAIYLPKQTETVLAILGVSMAGAVFVPINPILKPRQVCHILVDSDARVLVTSSARLAQLRGVLGACEQLLAVVLVDGELPGTGEAEETFAVYRWQDLSREQTPGLPPRIETDLAALLYTSGSTGRPKGVVLSHRNLVVGAESVAEYLENDSHDSILALLPLSFDAGLSQLTTAFVSGARAVIMDYLVPQDVVGTVARERITGITGVPPLWMQLVALKWPREATEHMRYFANTGGRMPRETLARLRSIFSTAKPYLMYGLTEAFRSTYLPPSEVDRIPNSIGKAIPNAEVLVVRPDGSPCAADEPGELVHRGPLVSLGYWKDPERTRERFKPAPGQPPGLPNPELAVWSGDTVRRDSDGYLYFIGRRDEMIKTSGYRVSPTEVEEVAFASGLVGEAAAVGVPHPHLGQEIVLFAKPVGDISEEALMKLYRSSLPTFMVPSRVFWRDHLPRNANGKIDRLELVASIERTAEGGS